MAVIIMKKQYYISSSEQISQVILPKRLTSEAGLSIMVGRKSLLNPNKVKVKEEIIFTMFYMRSWFLYKKLLLKELSHNILVKKAAKNYLNLS